MKNVLVSALVLGVVAGCGAAPPETAFFVKVQGLWCDRFYAALSDAQRQVPYSFYLGSSAGDCKAAFSDQLADAATQNTFGDRKFVQSEADKCTDAISKLANADVLQLAAAHIKINTGFGDMITATATKDALAKLGFAEDFTCHADANTCRADAGCSLGTSNGACAIYKWAPLKDSDLAAKELNAYTMGMNSTTNGCGTGVTL